MPGGALPSPSGADRMILRASGFYSNALQRVLKLRARDVVREPFDDVPIAAIDPSDIAGVAALALAARDPSGAICRLTGAHAHAAAIR